MEIEGTDKRKLTAAISAVVLASGLLLGIWFWSKARTEAEDRASIRAQRRGMGGMGMGMGNPQEMRKRMLDQMTKELSLTADQKSQIEAIQSSFRPGRPDQAGGNNSNVSQQQRFEEMRKSREEMETRIKAVLTPDQQTKYTAMQQQMRNRMGPGGGPPGMGGPGGGPGGGGPGGEGFGGGPPGGMSQNGMPPGPPPDGMFSGGGGPPGGGPMGDPNNAGQNTTQGTANRN